MIRNCVLLITLVNLRVCLVSIISTYRSLGQISFVFSYSDKIWVDHVACAADLVILLSELS